MEIDINVNMQNLHSFFFHQTSIDELDELTPMDVSVDIFTGKFELMYRSQ